jgi:hypothetical protein
MTHCRTLLALQVPGHLAVPKVALPVIFHPFIECHVPPLNADPYRQTLCSHSTHPSQNINIAVMIRVHQLAMSQRRDHPFLFVGSPSFSWCQATVCQHRRYAGTAAPGQRIDGSGPRLARQASHHARNRLRRSRPRRGV